MSQKNVPLGEVCHFFGTPGRRKTVEKFKIDLSLKSKLKCLAGGKIVRKAEDFHWSSIG